MFLTALSADIGFRCRLHPKVNVIQTAELKMNVKRSQQNEIQITAVLSLEAQWGNKANCCLDALQTAALWLSASGRQRGFKNTKSISATKGEVREN